MSTSTTAPPLYEQQQSSSLDTITASLVARQSRTDDGSQSVPDQIAAMRDWCARQSPPIVVGAVYEEPDVSGRRPLAKRHGLKRAVEDVESGRSQMIVVAYFDRFSRSVATRIEVLSRVEPLGGVVYTMDLGKTSNATPTSKFTGTVLAAVAEMFAEQTAEKTKVSKQRNIDNGIPPFPRITPAYQRREDGTLELHPINAPLIREAVEMRLRGDSFTKITRYLNEHGLAITHTGVTSTLESKLLIGEMHFGDFRPNLNAIDEPLLDRATFRRLHAAKSTRGRYGKSERLLARLDVLVCQTCDARMSVHTSSQRGGKRYAYYRCGNPLCAAPAIISASRVEDAVRDEVIRLSADYEGHASADAELEKSRLALEAAESKLSSVIRTLTTSGLASESASIEVLDELSAERDRASAVHARLVALTSPDRTVKLTLDKWSALSFERKRDVIVASHLRVVCAPGRGTDRLTFQVRD
jgi:DNA invertase Pin-like site-specific DNA recombinase